MALRCKLPSFFWPLAILAYSLSSLALLQPAPLHSEFSDLPEDAPVNHENLVRLQRANVRFARWYEEWDLIFGKSLLSARSCLLPTRSDLCNLSRRAAAKFGMETRNFYRESLQIQKEYAELFHNCAHLPSLALPTHTSSWAPSRPFLLAHAVPLSAHVGTALRGVRDASDVRKMDPAQRDLAIRALRNAQACLETCLRGVNYREALKYAVHYTRSSLSSLARRARAAADVERGTQTSARRSRRRC